MKKGLSTVIATVILILLTIVAVGIVWLAVKKIIEDPIGNVESCFGIFDKVNLNNQYTCYNSSSHEFQFSIDIKDIEVDELLISLSNPEASKTLKISSKGSHYDYLKLYSSSSNYGNEVTLPGENEGLTYVIDASEFNLQNITSIKIAPIMNQNQCEVSDSLLNIDNCALLT